jgi:Uri superfamily endonuclease
MEFPKSPGNYVMVGQCLQAFTLQAKSFGQVCLPGGLYLYCGSAHGPGGLAARIQRHLDPSTRKFWHYDHLKAYLIVTRVWWQVSSENCECETAQFLLGLPNAQTPIKGFGASDCRKGCRAHLVYFPQASSLEKAWRILSETGWKYQQIVPEER